MSRYPNLFIVGAPKCGTTSVYEYLRGHPDVFMPTLKEPCYFSPDLAFDLSGNFLRFGEDEREYLALFDGAGDAHIVGEGSTRYLYSSDAARLIKQASPQARIVVMVRNPVDMIASLHAHKLAADTEDLPDLAQAIDAEDDRRAGRRIPPRSNPKLSTYTDRARFAEQLDRYLAVFGKDGVHVIVLEDMLKAPADAFTGLLRFLALDDSYRPASFGAHNVAHVGRGRYLRRLVATRPAQWVAFKALPKLVGPARARGLIRRLSLSRFQRKPAPRPPLDPQLRLKLEALLLPDVERLSQLLGRDLAALWFRHGRQNDQPSSGGSPASPRATTT